MREWYKKQINSKLYSIADTIIFILGLFVSAIAMYTLCFRQAFTVNGYWTSDIKPYVEEMLGTNTRYIFPYPVMFKFAGIINFFTESPEFALTIAVTVFNGIAIVVVKVMLYKQTGAKLLSSFVSIAMFYVSMIYSSKFAAFGIANRYIGVYSPNPWHNHTYMAARPFMILAFIFGVLTLQNYEEDLKKGNRISLRQMSYYILFAILMLLVTMTKPSYTIVHMGAVGLIMIYRLIKNKFKTFRQTFLLGICYIPTIIDLLYQFFGVFTGSAFDGGDNGIGIGVFQIWSHYCGNIPFAMVLAATFPMLVLIFHYEELKINTQYRFSWIVYMMGLLSWCVFIEKGNRLYHGNFQWGYICGLFLVFLTSIVLVINETKDAILLKASAKQIIALGAEWMIFGIHLLMGLKYFYLITVFGADYF